MTPGPLPTLNAALNMLTAALLLGGYVSIRRGRPPVHKRFMLAGLFSSAVFLASYLAYHYRVGSVPYPFHDWTRNAYFAILVPHVVLAAVMVPFLAMAVWHALAGRFDKHRRIVRWLWPMWMFVSVSGLVVYLMLYR